MARLSIAAFGSGEDRNLEVVERRSANLVATCHPCSLVAETGSGKLVGLAITRRMGSLVLLAWAAVDPAHQGQGILRAMLESWPAHEAGTTRLVLASTDPRAMRSYAGLGLNVLPTISAGGILRRGAVAAPANAHEVRPLEAQALLAELGERARGGVYPPGDLASLDEEGHVVHVVDDGADRRAAVVRGGGIIRFAVGTDETAARTALRAALAAVPPGATVHINQMRAGMDWAIREALAARLELSPEAPVYADAPLSPLHLPNGSLG